MSYHAKAATVGNSKALRLDSALFRAHPEFASGEFEVNVISPGCMLVQATSETTAAETDPVFDAFLGFLEQQMTQRPELITAVTTADRRAADALLRGIHSDPDADLGDDFQVPSRRTPTRSKKRPARSAKR